MVKKNRPPTEVTGALDERFEGNGSGVKYLFESPVDEDGVQVSSHIGLDGREHPDPTPVEVPLHMRSSPGLDQLIKSYVRRELSIAAQENDFETFEEADDFEVEEDPTDRLTEYEQFFDPPPKESKESIADKSGGAAAASQTKPPVDPAVTADKETTKSGESVISDEK